MDNWLARVALAAALLFGASSASAQTLSDACACRLQIDNRPDALWTYRPRGGGSAQELAVRPPVFTIDGRAMPGVVTAFRPDGQRTLRNGVVERSFSGPLRSDPTIDLVATFRTSPQSPVVRFKYGLRSRSSHRLSKSAGKDSFSYLQVRAPATASAKEVRLSDFDERVHATTLSEQAVPERAFENGLAVMGPIFVFGDGGPGRYLLAYEHGSQFPERFLEFQLQPDRTVTLRAVKGNYLDQQPLDPQHGYETLWFQVAGAASGEDALADGYRQFVLKHLSENVESRRPYIFYNTWGRQERVKWAGGKYLDTMNLATTLAEIDVAHRMGVEVFVIDTGWFEKTGDWRVSRKLFPDELKQVKARLDQHGMKLGLWFNPTVAALSSEMLARNKANAMSSGGQPLTPYAVWETEPSQPLSLVSPYWKDFADELIRLNRELGVTYFKWDAVDQHGSDAAGHFHGTSAHSRKERADSYAFQLPLYLSKVADRVSEAAPEAIFDFDVTEPGRAVGLQFLSSGKFFLINNGPYFHNFDLAKPWESPLANGNANIFIHPGPARGWFARSALAYDRWIPSVLFLTHYQPDEPRASQVINLASLVLGQNGIWGEILKTSPEGVAYIGEVISKYKQVRDDITLASPVRQGEPGRSPEIHEKINPQTGKGAVVIFANAAGSYTYVTQRQTVSPHWATGGPVTVRRDGKGRAVIEANFSEPGARIVFFGPGGGAS
jgi:alpha-galactosidase